MMKFAPLALVAVLPAFASLSLAVDPTWTTINDTTSVATPSTRSLRSIALATNGDNTFYSGFIQGSSSQLLRIHDATTGNVTGSLSVGGAQPNTLATDDRGNVYMGTGGQFRIYNSTLTGTPGTFATSGVTNEGLDVVRSGATYLLYAAQNNGSVARYDVTNPAAPTLDTSFGVLGTLPIVGAGQLRGLDVGADGNIYVTQRDAAGSDRAGRVYRLDTSVLPNLPTVTSTPITGAMDVVERGGFLYVTEYNGTASEVSVLNAASLALLDEYDTNFPARGAAEGYAMLDINAAGNLYLVDQIYGGSGSGAGTMDRVLLSSVVPEPTTLAALAGAGAILGRRRRA